MTFDIFLFLLQDGIINAAVYALLSLSLILIFTVTRVICLPQGEFVSYGALTFALLQQDLFPATIYAVAGLGGVAAAYELGAALREKRSPSVGQLGFFIGYPLALLAALQTIALSELSVLAQIALTFLIVVPIGPMMYRVVFQPLASANILVLLIAAVAAHLVMVGGGLAIFGPEGARATPLSEANFVLGPLFISGQSIVIVLTSIVLMALLALVLQKTLFGKALRATAVNRAGARIVGIRPEGAGMVAFTIAATAGVLSGVLIAPVTTIYYDTGFVIALKGFVAAIIAGLFSYPLALGGAVFVGILEAFASFWNSAYREVIVFAILIPILLIRSLTTRAPKDEEE